MWYKTQKKQKQSKYKNVKTTVDGITFDSLKEANRYQLLKSYEKLGIIGSLKLQQTFDLAPSVVIQGKKRKPLRYKADFVYMECGKVVVEDSKGYKTPVYKLKRHLMMSVHGIEIRET